MLEKSVTHIILQLLTSSIVEGTSVRFLPVHATVSFVLSQLHILGHLLALAGELRVNVSRRTTAEKKSIYARVGSFANDTFVLQTSNGI